MGNTSAISSGAVIVVKLDNDIAMPGTELKGTVYLEVFKDSITADSLDIQFVGEEQTKVTYKQGKEEHSVRDKHVFFSVNCNLFSFTNGTCKKGKYEYPFSLNISKGIPIRYFLKCRLHRHGILTFDVKTSREVMMCDSPFDIIKTPIYMAPKNYDVYFVCCIKQGSMTIGLAANSSDIVENDKLEVNYVVHNNSTSTVKALKIWLREGRSCKAKGHSNYSSIDYSNVRIESNDLHGIKKLSKEEFSSILVDSDALRIELDAKTNQLLLAIPKLRSSYSGKLGTISHTLCVQLGTPFCVDDPIMEIPLRMHGRVSASHFSNTVSKTEDFTNKPADWNAVPERSVNLNPVSSKSSNSSVANLKELLADSNQWNEAYVVQDWIINNGDIDEFLVGSNLADVYSLIKADYSYIAFSDSLSKKLQGKMTCALICSAAYVATSNEAKINILNIFSTSCIDKSNAKSIFETLDLDNFSLSLVLSRYQ